jgi:YesN/AraC family two-component response regulator
MQLKEIVYSHHGSDPLNRQKHRHENSVEIIQILSGAGSFLVNDTLYPLRRGTVLIIDSDSLHCSIPEDGTEYIRNSLTVEKKDFLALRTLATEDSLPFTGAYFYSLGENRTEALSAVFQKFFQKHEAKTLGGWETVAGIADIIRNCTDSNRKKEDREIDADPILSYIDQNLDKPLTLEMVAKAMHFSKFHLCHVFRERTGMTLMQYIRLRRISRAKQLLLTTKMSVSEICMNCGYDNFSFFSRVFRSVTGMSPTEYRKRNH